MSAELTTYNFFLRKNITLCRRLSYNVGPDRYPSNPERVFELALQADTLPVAVILGQDPYPQEGVATGVAFANFKRVGNYANVPLSPSLVVIKDSVQKAYPGAFDETLESWIKQGILPLNTAFTVQKDNPGSDSMYWLIFTAKFLAELSEMCPNLYYILLGKRASFFAGHIAQSGHIIEELHPSYYARTKQEMSPEIWKNMTEYVQQTFDKIIHLTDATDKGQ